MDTGLDYIKANKELWNKRTGFHVQSEFYNVEAFIKGESSLNAIELDLLGNVKGKKILHLQCHFGQDSLSLARMGASVTGVDLSDKAIEKAKELSAQLDLDARFICSDLYELPNILDEQFDLVFTSYGTIGWLPYLDKWGAVVSRFLKDDGKFILVEFHPVVWMFDNDFTKLEYSYFNKEAIIEMEQNTYADREAAINVESITWNHPISEVFAGLTHNALQVTSLREYDYSPYNCFRHTEKIGEKKFIIKPLGDKIPLVYSVVAEKKAW
jgi:ubiquinone/menaquinone biosynthesis C-methylase UbiE